MKLLITALLMTVSMSAAWAQRVNNGDPGLALANSDTLPSGSILTRLAAAFERGSVPSIEFIKGVRNWSGQAYFSYPDTEKVAGPYPRVLSCVVREYGSIVPAELFCQQASVFISLPNSTADLLVQSTNSGLYFSGIRMYMRVYDNQLVGLSYGNQGKCLTDGLFPNENNVCFALYFYTKK